MSASALFRSSRCWPAAKEKERAGAGHPSNYDTMAMFVDQSETDARRRTDDLPRVPGDLERDEGCRRIPTQAEVEKPKKKTNDLYVSPSTFLPLKENRTSLAPLKPFNRSIVTLGAGAELRKTVTLSVPLGTTPAWIGCRHAGRYGRECTGDRSAASRCGDRGRAGDLRIFIWILTILTADMLGWEKRDAINFMKHPQILGRGLAACEGGRRPTRAWTVLP